MPRTTHIGGGKRKKQKKNATYSINKKNIDKKDESQMYAKVIKLLGGGRLNALCDDGKERNCKIRGKMLKKIFITAENIILISLREFEDGKADVIHRYNDDEATMLFKEGEIPKILMSENKQTNEKEKSETNDEILFFSDNDSDSNINEL
jgi:translation initiation factor 1A